MTKRLAKRQGRVLVGNRPHLVIMRVTRGRRPGEPSFVYLGTLDGGAVTPLDAMTVTERQADVLARLAAIAVGPEHAHFTD